MAYFIPTAGNFDTEILDPSNLRYFKVLVDTNDDDSLDDITTSVRNNKISGGQGKGYSGSQWTVEIYNWDNSIQEGAYAGALAQVQFKVATESYITIFTGYVSSKGAERKKKTLSDDVVTLTFWDLTKTKATKRKTPQGIYAGYDIVDTASESTSLFHVLAGFIGLGTSTVDVVSVDHPVSLLALKEDASAWKELQMLAAQYLADMYIRYDGKLRFKSRFETGWSAPTSEWSFYTQGENINVHAWRGYLRPKTATRVKSPFKLYEDMGAIRVYKNTDNWNSTTEKNAIIVAAGDYWPGPDATSVAQLMYRDPDTGDDYDFATGITTPTLGTVGTEDIVCSGGTLTLTSFNGSTSATQQNANSSEIILQNATGSPITITRFRIRANNAYLLTSNNDVEHAATVAAAEDHVDKRLPGKYISDYDQALESCQYTTDWAGVDREVYEIKTDLLPQIQKGALVTLEIVEESRSIDCYIESYIHKSDGPMGKAHTSIVLIKYLSFTYSGTNRVVTHRSYGTNRPYVDSTIHFDEDTGIDSIRTGNTLNVDSGASVVAGDVVLDGTGETFILGTGNNIIALDAADDTYRVAIGDATYATAPFRVTKGGALTATAGTVGGWTLGAGSFSTTNVTIDSANERMYLGANDELQADAGKARWSVFDNLGNEKVAIGYFDSTLTAPDGNPYSTSDYGLYVAGGNKVHIQVQMDLEGSDLVQADGSFSITEAVGDGGSTLIKIGTESAVVGYHLYDTSGVLKSSMHLSGDDLNITSGVTMAGTLAVTGVATLTEDLVVDTDTLFVDVSVDRVGIGTATPAQTLQVKGIVGFETTDATNYWAVYAHTDDTLRFNYNGAGNDEITILSDGKVGIGTSNPQYSTDFVSASDSYATVAAATIGIGNFTGIHFGYREENTDYRKSGIVFERTTSAAVGKIHILNDIAADPGSMALSDAKLTISDNGYVGIGTRSPDSILDIEGGNIIHRQSAAADGNHGLYCGGRNIHLCTNAYYDGAWKSLFYDATHGHDAALIQSAVNGNNHCLLVSVDLDVPSVDHELSFVAMMGVTNDGKLDLNGNSIRMNRNVNEATHTNADSYLYFASDAYIFWDESADYFEISKPIRFLKGQNTVTSFHSAISYSEGVVYSAFASYIQDGDTVVAHGGWKNASGVNRNQIISRIKREGSTLTFYSYSPDNDSISEFTCTDGEPTTFCVEMSIAI